jgi:GNAT superfamily N-acetyltransferase
MIEYDVSLLYEICSSLIDDEEQYLVNIRIKIIGTSDDPAVEDITVGEAEATQVRVRRAVERRMGLFHTFDLEQGLMDAGAAIYNSAFTDLKPAVYRDFSNPHPDEDLLLIRHIVLQPQFRGRKLGLILMHRILSDLGYRCGLAILKPFPIGTERGKEGEGRDKLRKYWERLGFQRVGKSSFWALDYPEAPPLADLELVSSINVESDATLNNSVPTMARQTGS